MKTWSTVLFASALILASAIVFAFQSPAISQQRGAGFMMAAGSAGMAWRVNTVTGAVSYCIIRNPGSSDPAYVASNVPVCSGFTPPAE